jgi:cobalt/nickel transport system permease protein
MSHIHIPDGVLPVWLWAPGWILALALVLVASRMSASSETARRIPLLGVVSALMLVSMSSEIVPLAYHVNLTVVAGVLLGPWLSPIAAFVVVVVLAMIGHGGVTVIGLNTLMIATEMVLGSFLFRTLVKVFSRRRVRWAAAAATVLTLVVTTTMLVGLVALAGAGPATGRETGQLDPSTLRFSSPFEKGVFSVNLLKGEGPAMSSQPRVSVGRFALVVYTLGSIGWIIEAAITASVIGYVARVRPSLVFVGGLPEMARVLPAHHHGAH